MSLRAMGARWALGAAWIFVASSGLAQKNQLSLKHGTYVLADSGCADPPFAAMMFWNGTGFSGAHASKCTTHVLSHRGNHYKVSTTCTALGDGTPEPAGSEDAVTLSLTRVSDTTFTVDNGTHAPSRYCWCSAK